MSWLSSILHKVAKPVAVIATVAGHPEIAAVAATEIRSKSVQQPVAYADGGQIPPDQVGVNPNMQAILLSAAGLGLVLLFATHSKTPELAKAVK